MIFRVNTQAEWNIGRLQFGLPLLGKTKDTVAGASVQIRQIYCAVFKWFSLIST